MQRILVVGTGSIGKRHVKNLRQLFPESLITVLKHSGCDDDWDPSEIDADACVGNIYEAIANKPQFAVIANPAPFHLNVAMPLAEAGIHLLIEKPISSTLKGLEDLIGICNKKNLKLMTGYNLRYLPSLQQFRKYILDKIVGEVLSVRAEVGQYLPTWRPNNKYQQTVSAQKNLGGGVLLELSHEIDYLLWLFGPISEVTAVISKQSDLKIDVEDTAHLIFKFSPDVHGHQLTASLNMDFIRQDTRRECTVIGNKGSLRWDGLSESVAMFDPEEDSWTELYSSKSDRNLTYQKEILHFVDCINNNNEVSISGIEGKAVLEVIEAARQSAQTGQTTIIASKD